MKLVEILARELKAWPIRAEELGQWPGGEVCVRDLIGVSAREVFTSNTIADDVDVWVTRAQWEAERARIAELDRGQYSLMTEEAEDWRNNCQKQYEQELWDKVAVSVASTVYADAMSEFAKTGCPCEDWRDYVASDICNMADAFMAERAKRLKR